MPPHGTRRMMRRNPVFRIANAYEGIKNQKPEYRVSHKSARAEALKSYSIRNRMDTAVCLSMRRDHQPTQGKQERSTHHLLRHVYRVRLPCRLPSLPPFYGLWKVEYIMVRACERGRWATDVIPTLGSPEICSPCHDPFSSWLRLGLSSFHPW